MWIADVLQQFKILDDIQCKVKDNVNLKGITIMGTVVHVIRSPPLSETTKNMPFIFDVDDGTGVLRVVYFSQSPIPSPNRSLNAGGELLANLLDTLIDSSDPIHVGHTLEVKGMPQIFTTSVEVKAFAIRQVIDPNDEIDRTFALGQWRIHCPIVKGTLNSNTSPS